VKVKILGVGCPSCHSMVNDVNRIVTQSGWLVDVEYVQDLDQILSYGVMAMPVLVIDEKVVMVGHRGRRKIEQVLQQAVALTAQSQTFLL
jgi:small redox-active disulfide protein 2